MKNSEVDFQAFLFIKLFSSSEGGLRVGTLNSFRIKLSWKLYPGAHVSTSASAIPGFKITGRTNLDIT